MGMVHKFVSLDDLQWFVEGRLGEVLATFRKGQQEYAHEHAFGNFLRTADECGLSPEMVWLVLFHKHIDGIAGYVRGYKQHREPIQGRILDAIVYLLILWGMVELYGDQQQDSGPQECEGRTTGAV